MHREVRIAIHRNRSLLNNLFFHSQRYAKHIFHNQLIMLVQCIDITKLTMLEHIFTHLFNCLFLVALAKKVKKSVGKTFREKIVFQDAYKSEDMLEYNGC